MGAPKQKWTAEEEAALKAGVIKYGAGKWRTILKDPEFSGILCLRSNVDLKDKWRNMCVMSNGWNSRERSKVISQRSHPVSKSSDDNPMPLSPVAEDSDDEILDDLPFAVSSEILHVAGPKRSTSRLANLIVEAIANLKEPRGSNKTAIAMYIEDQYMLPPDFADMLSMELETMTAHGKLIKVKRNYRIAPTHVFSQHRSSRMSLLDGRQKETTRVERDHCKPLIKSHVDFEIEKLRSMTSHEAAIAAEQAVAEAEAAIAEAEEAAREAEAAEAEAEAAQAFAEAAMRTLKNRKAGKLMVS